MKKEFVRTMEDLLHIRRVIQDILDRKTGHRTEEGMVRNIRSFQPFSNSGSYEELSTLENLLENVDDYIDQFCSHDYICEACQHESTATLFYVMYCRFCWKTVD